MMLCCCSGCWLLKKMSCWICEDSWGTKYARDEREATPGLFLRWSWYILYAQQNQDRPVLPWSNWARSKRTKREGKTGPVGTVQIYVKWAVAWTLWRTYEVFILAHSPLLCARLVIVPLSYGGISRKCTSIPDIHGVSQPGTRVHVTIDIFN